VFLARDGAQPSRVEAGEVAGAAVPGQHLVHVLAAAYDPATSKVTLRIGKVRNRKTLGTLVVAGLFDPLGQSFENGLPSNNVAVSVNLQSRTKHR
jgi:hypothetical protein